jgi:hypothetical protein
VTGGSLRAASADPSMSTGAVWRSCEAAATRRGRCELRAGRSELRLGSRRNLPAGPLPDLLGLRSPRAEPYTGIGVDSTFLSAWSIIDGSTLQTRFLRIFGTTTTRHMITRLSSLYSQCGKGQMRATWLHITSQLTARTGVVHFASHRTILYAPSTASYIRFVLRARTHSTDSLRQSSLRALRHLFG